MKLFGKLPVAIDRRSAIERAYSIEALRRLARRKLPAMVFDFIDGAAEDERTLRRNRTAFDDYALAPSVLVDVATRDQAVDVLGTTLPTPLILGPAGLAGAAYPKGEAVAARAAASRGIPFAVSIASSVSLEEVATAAGGGSLWFQPFLAGDRDLTRGLVARAQDAGYDVLCLTVDVPTSGQRERDLRHGFTVPPHLTVRNAFEVVTHPGWARRVLGGPTVTFGNFTDAARGDGGAALGQQFNRLMNPAATWDDLAWLREQWPGRLVVKGILRAPDAVRAVERGADGIVVSNHGGRQLDGVPGTLEVLPGIVDAVAGRAEVLLDSGVRRGTDVVKALALGARACLVARPYLYGLAAGGEAGVQRSIDVLRAEIDRTMALMGCATLADLTPEAVIRR